ncbi:hypothetical protein BCR44DRAFT_23526 [Catenaria anguillulae PL171]|uniref:Phospholipid/glycerol acyltransferase domain-containing protein n=1 Tax=Catenaria anguillulae PL171 TaxID=765915 RepID=A0A1Y2HS55_9FUNG|nr:hypothetical protein BCR44DRAFT_23526 [Catenaria anguillulae PL171]
MATLVYDTLAWLFSFIIGIFFRDIRVRGQHSIPKYGPVIFVAAPHHNQFVDPIMLIRTANRRIGFLSAQKTMDRKYVGKFAKAFGAIGVVRAQDIAVKLPGAVHLPDPTNAPDTLIVVGGKGDLSSLVAQGKIGPGFSLLFNLPMQPGNPQKGGEMACEIADVLANGTTIKLRRAVTDPDLIAALAFPGGLPAKSAPKVDYHQMYDAVYERLNDGRCIGIFPEGGSHDRSELLPFKAGVAIMALGAMDKYPGLDVKLVPVGLSYFHADRFRSRAVVEYGQPITVPKELVAQYANGGNDKRNACKALLDVIQAAVANVTVTAPDYSSLMVVQAVRRLYRPLNRKLTMVQKLELTRRLMKGYTKFKDDPRVRDLEQKVQYYNQLLAYYGLADHQVERTAIGGPSALLLLLKRLGLLVIMGIVALPGTLLNAPIAIAASRISTKKAKEALAASTVKIEGRDVLATWKLLVTLVLVPLTYVAYTLISWILVRFVFVLGSPWTWLVPLAVFTGLPYISLVALSWGETGADIYKSLAPLMFSILPTRWHSSHNLRQVRSQLARDLNDIINELGPTLFPDFKTFFLHDTVIPTAQQSAAGLTRVSSWVSNWLVNQGIAPSSKSGLNLALELPATGSAAAASSTAALAASGKDKPSESRPPHHPHGLSGDDLTRYFVTPASPSRENSLQAASSTSASSESISSSSAPSLAPSNRLVVSVAPASTINRTRSGSSPATPSPLHQTAGSSSGAGAITDSTTASTMSNSSWASSQMGVPSSGSGHASGAESDDEAGIVVIKASDVLKATTAVTSRAGKASGEPNEGKAQEDGQQQ